MNVAEINPGTLETLGSYVISTVILTVITAWVVVALQDHSSFHDGKKDWVKRVAWPIFYMRKLMQRLMAMIKTWRDRRRRATA